MAVTWVYFQEVELVPERHVTASFRAEITFQDAGNWDVTAISLATFKRDLSRMFTYDLLKPSSPLWPILCAYATGPGARDVQQAVDDEIDDCGGEREIARMAAE